MKKIWNPTAELNAIQAFHMLYIDKKTGWRTGLYFPLPHILFPRQTWPPIDSKIP
jgi:hypothetical protein